MSKAKQPTRRLGKKYLFSYGTLQPKHAPAEIAPTVRQFRRVGTGFVRGRLYDFGEYPGAVLSKNGLPVRGQVFELPDDPEILSRLDEYEGFNPSQPRGSLFVRRRCLVTLKDGKKLNCWVYTYNQPLGAAAPLPARRPSKLRARRTR